MQNTSAKPLRLQFIVCQVMQREAYYCASRTRNIVDIVLMPQGLHNTPDKLKAEVQKALDRTEDGAGKPYDATLLGYGLCSNGIVGLASKIPLVVVRGHDCMTMLLGSKKRYKEYFDSHRGTYWYSPGWLEHGCQPGKEKYERALAEYEAKFGKDNAKYLMETQEGWMKEYSWATYIDWGLGPAKEYKKATRDAAAFLGWNYDEITGDPGLMQRLLDGDWNPGEFLVLSPGAKIAADVTSDDIIAEER
jgi:hypothetical protein